MDDLGSMVSPVRRVAMVVLHSHPLADPGAGDAGGMSVYVGEVARALAAHGVEVDLYTRIDCPCRPEEQVLFPGVRVIQLEAGPPKLPKERLVEYLPEFSARMLERIEARGDTYDLIHSHYWLSGSVGYSVARRLGVPFVHTFHTLGRVKNSSLRRIDRPEAEPRLAGEAKVVAAADAIVASTAQERRWLIDLYGARAERIHLIPPGVDHAAFLPGDRRERRRALGIESARVLLFAGRLQPLKAPDTAIRALARLTRSGRFPPDDTRLLVVGGASGPVGEDEPHRLRLLAGRLGVEKAVSFLPAQPHADMPGFFQAADVCLVPSYTETFGLVALEAQASGVPVVASAVGGLKSIVRDAETGFLVAPGSPQQFADRIGRILNSEPMRERMSRRAVAASLAFSWDSSARRLLELYRSTWTNRMLGEGGGNEDAKKVSRPRRKVSRAY